MEQTGVFDPVPKAELLKRMEGLKTLMAENQVDVAVICQNVDKFYFTGTVQKGMLVLPVAGDPLFFVEKNVERAMAESPLAVFPVASEKAIGPILREKGLLSGVAGFELDVLPVNTFEKLRRLLGFDRYADISGAIRTLRMIKSPFELGQIRKSGQMMTHVFRSAPAAVREGAREIDIEAALVAEGKRLGHQGFLRMRGFNQEMTTMTVQAGFTGAEFCYADVPIAGAGLTPAVPMGSSLKKVERGIPVTIDYGGGYNGYITDETRAFVVGKLDPAFEKPCALTLEILQDLMGNTLPGMDATALFARACHIVQKAGLEAYFMGHGKGQVSFIGHGIGLEINELPVITARYPTVLQEGMVFAVEPKFVLPGKGAIGIELDFIVGKDGLERVTTGPFELVVV